MEDRRLGRRSVLAAAGAGLSAAVAGCATPETGGWIEGDSSTDDLDLGEPAGDAVFTAVYEQTIDSVVQVRAFGVSDPVSGREGQASGSGFVFGDRTIVTNEHVVSGGEGIDVQYINGDWSEVTVLGTDFYSDLAVLEPSHVPSQSTPLPLRESPPVPGEEVLAIGNPFGLEGSMSRGIVSGVNRSLDLPNRQFSFPNVVQTDAGVNPGNSGGPLVDLEARVVGVVNATGGDNVGFAISAALADRVVPALIEDGEYGHSFLGITLVGVDRLVAEENGLEVASGVIVDEVIDEPAQGVLAGSTDRVQRHGQTIPVGGDVIRSIDGESIPDRHALSTHLALETSPGDTVEIGIVRDGETTTVELTLAVRPVPG